MDDVQEEIRLATRLSSYGAASKRKPSLSDLDRQRDVYGPSFVERVQERNRRLNRARKQPRKQPANV